MLFLETLVVLRASLKSSIKLGMLEIYQHTVKEKVSFSGVGLHSGKNAKVTILPGKEDQGFIFKRTDLKENNLVPATFKNVSSAKLCTTLENKFGIKVSTVEHLLAAFILLKLIMQLLKSTMKKFL